MILSERDKIYVEHMLECIERVERFTGNEKNRFMESELVQDAVVRNLQTMAESSQRLSDEIKDTQPQIDWRAIAGFRNVLAHDYLGLDLETIWLVIENEFSPLREALKTMQGYDEC